MRIVIIIFIVMILNHLCKSLTKNHSILNKKNNILRMASNTAINGSKYVLVPIGDGSEEIETTTIVDTLVRGGAVVTLASVSNNLQVTCSRGVKLVADKFIQECVNDSWDLVVCPGGMNPETFRLYEALELGAIPLYVRQEGDEMYFKYLSNMLPILNVESWEYASKLMGHMINNPELMEKYRDNLLRGWIIAKKQYADSVKSMFAQIII
jgi:hypothetical protein